MRTLRAVQLDAQHKEYMIFKTTNLLLFSFFITISAISAQGDFCKGTDSLGAKTYFVKARMAYQQGKPAVAIENFQKASKAYLQMGCKERVFLMNRNILKVHIATANMVAFDALYYKIIKSLENAKESEQLIYKGRVMLLKSDIHLSLKQLDSAIIYANKARAVHKEVAAWKFYIRDNAQLARIAFYQQNYEAMEDYVDLCFDTYKTYIKDKGKILQDIMALYGGLYYKTGEYETALEKTMEALEVGLADMTTKDDTLFVARYYNNIGLFYIELGDIYKAEDYCNNALQLFKKLRKHFDAATTNLNLGEFFTRQGKLEEALRFYQAGIKSLEQSSGVATHQLDKSSINIYNGIGDVATRLNRYQEAFMALKKNLEIHKREQAKKDETFSVLGSYYRATRDYTKSLNYYQEALVIRKQTYGLVHPLVAKVYYDLGQTEQKRNHIAAAKTYYDLAIAALEVPVKGDLMPFLMNKDSANTVPDKSLLLKVLAAKARLSLEEKNLELAYNTAQSAVLLLEKMRNGFKEEGSKLFMLQKMIPTYELSIDVALDLYQQTKEQSYLDEIFQLVEKSKAMLLLDALKAEEARNFGNVPKDLLDEERRLARERVRYEKLLFEAKSVNDEAKVSLQQKELLKLKRASEKLQTTLEQDYPKYHELKYNTQIASLKQVQESLDDQTALIEYFVGNENIYIFSIYRDTAWLTSVSMNNQFTTAIKGLRTSLVDVVMLTKDVESSYLLFARNARTIYQKYLEPALKKEQIERLVIIPDGMFNYVPFDVLLTEKPDYKNYDYRKLPYLIKSYSINYHYSSTLKLFSRSSSKTNGEMLAMASSYDKEQFINMKGLGEREYKIRSSVDDLPGARQEVEYLSNIFAGEYLYGDKANETTFKSYSNKEPYSVIHLAMHGIVDAKQPAYSSLVFSYSGSKKEDDLLHAYELNLLEVNTDLVVLSACETGFGRYDRGEGVVSLGRGFMYSGVPSLVMTLWPINDKATSILVSEFYNELAIGHSKDEAMKNAKLTYLKHAKHLTAHPFFWASFVNFGDYQPIHLKKSWTWGQLSLLTLPILLLMGWWFSRKRKG
ncbi:CHAT domain-containing protein [Aureispira anguillae]|uniref:CHAT domain-containing protein n=1 Tax=Aureispira anguillae TaxID=2864201 RepID=A0A915YEZ5_9BACT|nr:CHAT domain-containing protein [Aureispira anguillae]BDS11903.1 CHAT domain-containing protein [Aureispira anguillae]